MKTDRCPECGSEDYLNINIVGDGYRECMACGQDWWIDIDYTALNPGGAEAKAKGCTCPVMDNARGKGCLGGAKDEYGQTVFVITAGCPLHDKEESDE